MQRRIRRDVQVWTCVSVYDKLIEWRVFLCVCVHTHSMSMYVCMYVRMQALLEEFLVPALSHKNWRVKEEGMQCLTQVLAKYGGQGLILSKFVGTVCKLLEDPNPQVGVAVGVVGWMTRGIEVLCCVLSSPPINCMCSHCSSGCVHTYSM